MSRLDRSFHPALTEDVLRALFKRKIFTALTFVQTDPEFLVRISRLQYSKVLQIKNSILTKFSSPLITADNLYDEIISHCAILQTGIENLDKLLDGGLVTGNVYELCGPAGSGKTQICTTIAINLCSSFPEQTVLYVDTKNDLSARRIREIIENNPERYGSDPCALMNRIKTCAILRAPDLNSFLHGLSADLRRAEGKSLGFRLLIVDSLPALFLGYLGEDWNRGTILLNDLANLLHFIAVEYHVAVLVTNLVTNWSVEVGPATESECQTHSQIQTPVLGKYWLHVPNTRINVKSLENVDGSLLVIMKSTTLPVGKTSRVAISSAGVS